tara:strand:- start:550 stop:750 length:201 start_codon:yes stop_codon:yes gene_type:complete
VDSSFLGVTVLAHMKDETKSMVDLASLFTVLGTLLEWLPHVAAFFTIVWTGIRIWETDTVQGWRNK